MIFTADLSLLVFSGEGSDSILVENLLASVSQHRRQKNAEQTKNRMRARALNGLLDVRGSSGCAYLYKPGQGKILLRDEPQVSIITEALEGFASVRAVRLSGRG